MNHVIRSLEAVGAPQHILAALEALQQVPSLDRLVRLSEPERRRFLNWCDIRQVTLMLANVCGSALPPWVTAPAVQRMARYELRFERLKQQLFEIVDAFNAAGLEFVMLKGLSHSPALTPDPRWRAQGDIDFWLIGSSAYKGQDILKRLGYQSTLESTSRHLAPMTRPSNWRWRGDLFDPEMPVSVELHYELWSEEAEYISIPQLHQFWDRKQVRDFDGHKIPVLCDSDLLGFACLHLLLHLLHGELPLQRAWEIARFLDTQVNDDSFWTSWRTSHPENLRELETCIFCLARNWFGCRTRDELQADAQRLPTVVQSWLAEFPLAPLRSEWAPNKSEIWLHLALIPNRTHKVRVLLRRLFPSSTRDGARGLSKRLSFGLLLTRFTRHAVTFFPTLISGLRWFLLGSKRQQVAGSDTPSNARFAVEGPTSNLPSSIPSEERV